MSTDPEVIQKASVIQSLRKWGENSFNPMITATLIAPQHLRPVQPLGLLMCGAFIGTSFFSLHGYKSDAGGMLAASSGLYVLLASRRRFKIRDRFGPRGILRGATVGLCAVNFVSGLLVYVGKEKSPLLDDEGNT